MSRVIRKPDFCICENKDADQLRGDREADQRLCFRYVDSTIPLLPKSESSSLQPSCVVAQPGLCRTWSETPKTGFLTTRLKSLQLNQTLVCFYYEEIFLRLIFIVLWLSGRRSRKTVHRYAVRQIHNKTKNMFHCQGTI